MTIREFAKLCNVSPATASRFFAGKPLSEQTRSHVRAMAEKTGYEPSPTYRRPKHSGLIAVAVPDYRHCFFSDIQEYLQKYISAAGYRYIALFGSSAQYVESVRHLLPDGVVLLDEKNSRELIDTLSDLRIPAVVCGAPALDRRLSSVHIDDMVAAYDGTSYLLERGHREIGFLSDEAGTISSGFQRITGCKKALCDWGITPLEHRFLSVGSTFPDGYEGMRQLLAQQPEGIPAGGLSAVFCFSDDMAAGAAACLYDQGLRVPQDISLLGFDDNTMACTMRPRLTTIRQPFAEIAALCVEKLLARAPSGSITLPHTMAERDSCRLYQPK